MGVGVECEGAERVGVLVGCERGGGVSGVPAAALGL